MLLSSLFILPLDPYGNITALGLEKADNEGVAFGFVMGFENEWGSVYMPEIESHIASIARGNELNYIMAPFGYIWEDEKELHKKACE